MNIFSNIKALATYISHHMFLILQDTLNAKKYNFSHIDPMQGEIIACIQGIQAAAEAGVGNVIIVMDASTVVQAVYSSAYDLSTVTYLVAELRSLLSLNFLSWRVQYRSRSCNRVAHELAALGSLSSLDVEPVLVPIPCHIQSVIADNSALFE
jgi:hypothetical protein